jgi:hypothetical protein
MLKDVRPAVPVGAAMVGYRGPTRHVHVLFLESMLTAGQGYVYG